MAIGRFLTEAVAEGFVFKYLGKIWGFLSGTLASKAGEKILESVVDTQGRSLNDELRFSEFLAKADDPKNMKPLLKSVIYTLEEEDRRNKTRYVKNFRLILALGAGEPKILKNTKKTGKDTSETKEELDPNYKPPGLFILEEMLKKCTTEDEFRLAIYVTGAMQDAPFGSFDEFKFWARKTALPMAITWLQSGSEKATEITTKLEEKVSTRADGYHQQSWIKKFFLNR